MAGTAQFGDSSSRVARLAELFASMTTVEDGAACLYRRVQRTLRIECVHCMLKKEKGDIGIDDRRFEYELLVPSLHGQRIGRLERELRQFLASASPRSGPHIWSYDN
jgi:hypothetical protein